MTNTGTAARTARLVAHLIPGDRLLAGHGHGEEPGVVVNVARFTRSATFVTLLDGRHLSLRSDLTVDVAA